MDWDDIATQDRQNFWGLVRTDGTPKPSFLAV